MSIPLIQKYSISRYIYRQKAAGRRYFPLVLMLEPLFRCNLSCTGCGKIAWPEEVLARQLSADECLAAAEESGAPVVSIAGGESLIHEEMPQIVSGLTGLKKFVYLCTNGLLVKKKIRDYRPSQYLTFSIHLDGPRQLHDSLAGRTGVFDHAVEAMRELNARGFRFTVNCTVYNGLEVEDISMFFDFIMGLGAEGITISPGYSYPDASGKGLFLERAARKGSSGEILRRGKRARVEIQSFSLYLDFLARNRSYACSPWGTVTRNIFGWQKPCYLFADEYVNNIKILLEKTDWLSYGPGVNPQCRDCMMHSGFEATAVNNMISNPLKAFAVYLRGPATDGPFAPDPAEKP